LERTPPADPGTWVWDLADAGVRTGSAAPAPDPGTGWTGHEKRMSADALICSHPRSGGRWLRFLLAHYLSNRHRLDWPISRESVFGIVPDHQDESARGYRAFRF